MKNPKLDQSLPFHLDGGSPGKFDAPLNKLEKILIKLSQKKILVYEFLEIFFNSSVYIVLVEDQLPGSGDRTTLVQNPTTFSLQHSDYNSICFYSHPSRIQPTTEKFPEFKYECKVVAGDFIFGIENDIGITINPYWDINFEWSKQQVAGMEKMIKRTEPDSSCDKGYKQ